MDIDAVAIMLEAIGKATPIYGAGSVRVRGFNDFPDLVNEGDCPQLVHTFVAGKQQRETFGEPPALNTLEYTFGVFYLQQPFALGITPDTAPAILRFIGNYLRSIRAQDTQVDENGDVTIRLTAEAGPMQHDLSINGIQFRGVRFSVKATEFV